MTIHTRTSTQSTDLREVLRRLNPNAPAGLDASSIPRTERDSNALRQLRTYLNADPYAKALLTGHIGVGKSTELLHLAREMESERYVIRCWIAQTLGVHNIDTFSLLVVILDASIQSWVRHLGEIPTGLVQELVDHVRNLSPEGKRPPKQPRVPALSSISLYEILGEVPARIKTGEQLSRLYTEVLQRLALRYVPAEQIALLDPSGMALSCEIVLKELANKVDKPIFLVIDDLDKVRDERVQTDVFLDRAMAWMRLPCGLLATLPLDALFTSRGRELDHVWGEVQILDPLPVPELIGQDYDEPALQPFLRILRSVGGEKAISALQCRRLAHLSSGVLRLFVYASAACVRYAIDAKESHVRDYHVDLVQRDLTDRWRGRLNDSDYEALTAVLDSAGSNVPKAIPLLRDGLLIRDGSQPGEKQFRLASWVVPLVEAYRSRRLDK